MTRLDFSNRLLKLLEQKDLPARTIALGAELLAAVVRFNACIAERRSQGQGSELTPLIQICESCLEHCAQELNSFESSRDPRTLEPALLAARELLQRKLVELGGAG